MSEAANAARSRALSLVGQGYIYGAKGQRCSSVFRAGQARQYPEQAGNILGVGAKWDGKPVWDCAQLTRTVAAAAGITLPSGATSQWNKAAWERFGEIAALPAGELAFLYRRQSGSNTVMAHTGVCLGDGTCVHARGTAYGVVRQGMDSYPWTHWASPWASTGGIPDGSEGDRLEGSYRAVVTAESGSTVRVRATPRGQVLEALKLGAEVAVLEEADGWCRIAYGEGKSGFMDGRFLRRAEEADSISLETLAERVAEIEKRLERAGM